MIPPIPTHAASAEMTLLVGVEWGTVHVAETPEYESLKAAYPAQLFERWMRGALAASTALPESPKMARTRMKKMNFLTHIYK